MIKKIPLIFLIIVTFVVFFLFNATLVWAQPCNPTDNLPNHGCDTSLSLICKPTTNGNEDQGSCEKKIGRSKPCNPTDNLPNHGCDTSLSLICKPTTNGNEDQGSCEKGQIKDVFGTVKPPDALEELLKNDPTGVGAISRFLSNGVNLIYSIAAIILLFMILWGAFEWLTSGGDKEHLASAQRRLINAFIGILIFAAAFAILQVVGTFTGFSFFKEKNYRVLERNPEGKITKFSCTTKSGEYGVSWGVDDAYAETRCKE